MLLNDALILVLAVTGTGSAAPAGRNVYLLVLVLNININILNIRSFGSFGTIFSDIACYDLLAPYPPSYYVCSSYLLEDVSRTVGWSGGTLGLKKYDRNLSVSAVPAVFKLDSASFIIASL